MCLRCEYLEQIRKEFIWFYLPEIESFFVERLQEVENGADPEPNQWANEVQQILATGNYSPHY